MGLLGLFLSKGLQPRLRNPLKIITTQKPALVLFEKKKKKTYLLGRAGPHALLGAAPVGVAGLSLLWRPAPLQRLLWLPLAAA